MVRVQPFTLFTMQHHESVNKVHCHNNKPIRDTVMSLQPHSCTNSNQRILVELEVQITSGPL